MAEFDGPLATAMLRFSERVDAATDGTGVAELPPLCLGLGVSERKRVAAGEEPRSAAALVIVLLTGVNAGRIAREAEAR